MSEKKDFKITKAYLQYLESTLQNFMKTKETFHFIYDQIDKYANSIVPFYLWLILSAFSIFIYM